MRKSALAALLLFSLALPTGCGDDGDAGAGERSRLVVSAATSLKRALTDYGRDSPGADVRLSFAGSDELAAQIRQGVKPDLYAAANTKLPQALFGEGLVEKPVVFASNRLVLAVPAGSHRVRSIGDLGAPGVTLAIGAESVPVGSYTRELLGRFGRSESEAILGNVRSNEPDVGGVVGKLSQGAVDAGFVYATDAAGAAGEIEAIDLPDELQPSVAYGAAVVKGARNPEAAREFLAGLLDGAGAEKLRAAGFDPPPR